MKILLYLLTGPMLCLAIPTHAETFQSQITDSGAITPIPVNRMQQVYEEVKILFKHDNVVYHYYCAVGDQGRVIALATSKELGRK